MERVQKCAMWLATLAMALFVPAVAMAAEGRDPTNNPNGFDISSFAMMISFGILCFTAMLGPVTANPNRKTLPKWAWVTLVYAVIGLLAAFPLSIFSDRTSAVSAVYIPGTAFCVNLLLTFLIQNWMASEKLGFSLWKVLPVNGLFATWTCFALTHVFDVRFIFISAVVVVMTLLTTLAIVMITDKRMQALAEQHKSATS